MHPPRAPGGALMKYPDTALNRAQSRYGLSGAPGTTLADRRSPVSDDNSLTATAPLQTVALHECHHSEVRIEEVGSIVGKYRRKTGCRRGKRVTLPERAIGLK